MSWGAWVIIGWLWFSAWLSTAMAIKTVGKQSSRAAAAYAILFMWAMPMIYILEHFGGPKK